MVSTFHSIILVSLKTSPSFVIKELASSLAMLNLSTRALILLGLGVTLVAILSVEATLIDGGIQPVGSHFEGGPKLIQKREVGDDNSDEKPHKKKGRKRKSTTTVSPNSSTTPSSNSTTSVPTSSTTTAPSSKSSSTTSSPTSTTTNSPSTTSSANLNPSSTTTKPSSQTTTSKPNLSTSTLAPPTPPDMKKDSSDIERMDDLVKTQNEEYELIKKAMTATIDWSRWLREHGVQEGIMFTESLFKKKI